MRPFELAQGVHWVGTIDPQLRRFDVIMQASHGTTYNSYLVRGKDKVALIDASKGVFSASYIENLRELIDPADIDYIVLNHMEPDHSGALEPLLKVATKAVVYLTKPGYSFAREIVNRDFANRQIADGETLDLGGRTLRFIIAPYLHWPDTMLTYLEEDGLLFSCDFFGAHYCDNSLFNDMVGNYDYAFHYYFMAIMRPFKEHVRSGLDKIAGLKLNMICPSHGPVIRANLQSYIDRYREWSAEPPLRAHKKLLVFYVSAYGNTAIMAQKIAEGANQAGAQTELYDLTDYDLTEVLSSVENADGIAVGSCTINGDAVENAWVFLSSLTTIKFKGKVAAAFGTYAWSGEGAKLLTERLKGLKFNVPLEPLRIKLVVDEAKQAQCVEFGKALAAAL